jgi:hypothetical protein
MSADQETLSRWVRALDRMSEELSDLAGCLQLDSVSGGLSDDEQRRLDHTLGRVESIHERLDALAETVHRRWVDEQSRECA